MAQFPDEQSDEGEFERQEDAFRDWVSTDGSTPYPVESGRYHLYVSLACPWASRTVIVRKVQKLEEVIGLTVVDPIRDELGWAFREGPGYTHDPINHFMYLREAYVASDPTFDGRVTVPVLWDKETKRIVNNSEDDICRMFNDEFGGVLTVDLFPEELEPDHEELSQFIYEKVNNGVYRAGFASKQSAYERACRTLFEALDRLEARLAQQRYLFGGCIVEADWRLFCTLVRFDAVYHGHFKCNRNKLTEMPALWGYARDLFQTRGFGDNTVFDQIKRHYYVVHDQLNPSGIVPGGPELDGWLKPHGRGRL